MSLTTEHLTDGVILANTLLFSNEPRHRYEFFLPPTGHPLPYGCGADKVINYSQLYEEFVTRNLCSESKAYYEQRLRRPRSLCGGDVVQTVEYRGVGAYYVLWMHKDAFRNPSYLSPAYAMDIKILKAQEEEQNGNNKRKRKRATHTDTHTETDDDEGLSAYDYGLDDDTIRAVQHLLRGECRGLYVHGQGRESARALLAPLLQEKAPTLLDELCAVDNISALSAFSVHFAEEAPPRESGEYEEDEEEGDNEEDREREDDKEEEELEVDEEGNIHHASELLRRLPPSTYPLMLRRSKLTAALAESREERKREREEEEEKDEKRFACFLFSHCDEMGYNAPTAMSVARQGYLPQQDGDGSRDVDLRLLPAPLDTETQMGRALNALRRRLPEREENDEEEEEEDDEEDEEDDDDDDGDDEDDDHAGKEKKKAMLDKAEAEDEEEEDSEKNVFMIDFAGEDTISAPVTCHKASDWYGFKKNYAKFSPLLVTRRVFKKHAECVRRDLSLSPALTADVEQALENVDKENAVCVAAELRPVFNKYLGL